MKTKVLFLALFLFQSISLLAQDMASLKIEALRSYKASMELNYDVIFDTTYPKLFDLISIEEMKTMFEEMTENEQFSIKLIEVDPQFSYGEIKVIEDKTFCLVDYNNVMTMRFKEPMTDPDSMIENFKSSIGADKVTFDNANNTFRIETRSTLIGIADELTKNKWKFLNKDKENQMFSMLFNENIKKALGL